MNFNEILYGVAYYDEYMPYDRIETDFKMIRDAGMNVIRIAESTWSTWEPEEGVFDFTHLHRMLDCAAKYKLKVIVGTPTYAIPSWLAKKYPDTAWCYGNHDLSYVWHVPETGYSTMAAYTVQKKLLDLKEVLPESKGLRLRDRLPARQ